MPDPRLPVLVGVAQSTVRPPDGPAPEPLAWWETVARAAATDAGAPGLIDRLDSLRVVFCQSWQYDDPAGRLAERLGVEPAHRHYSGISGTVPLVQLAEAARDIAAGRCSAVLVVGAESLATKRALKKAGERPSWSHRHPSPPAYPIERMPADTELAHEVFQAWETFALFDVARRGARGVSFADEQAERGAMMAPMTAVAAKNPHAWFPVERSADELVTPTADNRLVGWPYTKYTVAVMDVDMAAAALLVSAELADSLGIDSDRRVHLHGWGYAEDPWTVAAHPDLASSPAMHAASQTALQQAGVTVDDVEHLDLYSCFASSLRFACDALGLDPLDRRGLTVTGGLPFAGGPASNYTLHSVASMVERLRAQPGSYGLVSGVGMHLTKHAFTLWSTEPATPPVEAAPTPEPVELAVVDAYDGDAQVAAYTVAHGRDGAPQSGLLVVDVPDGRAYARVREPDLLTEAEESELVGRRVTVTTDGRTNTASW